MFDFSIAAILFDRPWLAPLYRAWLTFDPAAWAAVVVGAGLIVGAVLGVSWLPFATTLRRLALWAGVLLVVGGLGWQVAVAEGVRRTQAAQHEISLAAEQARTREARDQNEKDRAQAARDHAVTQAEKAKLERLLNAQPRKDADRVVLPRSVARGLRDL